MRIRFFDLGASSFVRKEREGMFPAANFDDCFWSRSRKEKRQFNEIDFFVFALSLCVSPAKTIRGTATHFHSLISLSLLLLSAPSTASCVVGERCWTRERWMEWSKLGDASVRSFAWTFLVVVFRWSTARLVVLSFLFPYLYLVDSHSRKDLRTDISKIFSCL